MKSAAKNKKSKRLEVEGLRIRLEEAEETLRAIRRGEVDGIVVDGAAGKHIYTLKGADESYRILMEAMNEGALVLDPTGTIVYANRRVADQVQKPLHEVTGAPALHFIPPEFQGAFRELVEACKAGPSQRELALRRSDGLLVPVQLSASEVRLESQPGLCVLVSDLTDQKRREQARRTEIKAADTQIRRHVAELESTNRELEAFVYSVSHDLRAPLRSIHRFGTLLLEEHADPLNDEGKEYLQRMTAAAERMDELIRGLLGYARISREEIRLHPVQTGGIVSEVLTQLADDLRQCGADVRVDEPLLTVRGDALLLSQAMTNLVANGIKFVAPGVRPRLRVWSERCGAWVRLWVEDNGIGIGGEDQSRLFRVFERLGNPDYPGTGIGLAIVKRAAERMGGTAGVESKLGKGSRFWIDLPSLTGGAQP